MELRGVGQAVQDDDEIVGIWFGELFVWPDPWWDTWQDEAQRLWENVWTNEWSVT
jgi:hypothetical protein